MRVISKKLVPKTDAPKLNLYFEQNILYLAAVILSVVTFIVLIKEKKHLASPGAVHLMIYLISLSISNILVILVSSRLILSTPILFKVFMPLSFITPVSGYLYIKYSLNQENENFSRVWPHYIVALIIAIHYLPFAFKSLDYNFEILNRIMENPELIVTLSYGWLFSEKQIILLRSIQTAIYLTLSYLAIKNFSSINSQNISAGKNFRYFRWIKFFFWSKLIYFILIILLYVLFQNQFNGVTNNLLFQRTAFIATSLIALIISSYLIINPKLLLITGEVIRPNSKKLYKQANSEKIIGQIRDTGLHLDGSINKPRLAIALNITTNELNGIIKAAGFRNFNQFINQIRLEYFLFQATREQLKINSIEGIAIASGFNSTSTFYRVFKEKYGISPKEYFTSLENEGYFH